MAPTAVSNGADVGVDDDSGTSDDSAADAPSLQSQLFQSNIIVLLSPRPSASARASLPALPVQVSRAVIAQVISLGEDVSFVSVSSKPVIFDYSAICLGETVSFVSVLSEPVIFDTPVPALPVRRCCPTTTPRAT